MVHDTLYFVSDSFIANVSAHIRRINCIPIERLTSPTSARTRMRHVKLHYLKKERFHLHQLRSELAFIYLDEYTVHDTLFDIII